MVGKLPTDEEKSSFIAVGCSSAGEDGLIEGLRKLEYKVNHKNK